MVTILSFPVQQQHASKSYIRTSNFPKHFGLKTHMNQMFDWCNKFRIIHVKILLVCMFFGYWLPLMNSTSAEMLELSSYSINGSLTKDEEFYRAYAKRCLLVPPSLLSVTSIDNINSYKSMKILIVLLIGGSYIFMMGAHIISTPESDFPLENPYMWFCWCLKILIYLVGSSICHQLASALACRPMEILYDLRYISMLIMQISGFFICLSFAFLLGVKFASIKTEHRLSKCSTRVIIV
ncbi:unnamed protein product [Rotaria socialis]|uniref:Uncharacterized protein n=2 Tax=Rotaria socialis TaxID=392032 RepID=A0A818SFR8_9BILA|nr:unnamed protein product [Rotaria socialis]CAF3700277.1 unnamed protein product [Rotaria socialis]